MYFIEVYQECHDACRANNRVVFQTNELYTMTILTYGNVAYMTNGKANVYLPVTCPVCGFKSFYHFHIVGKS